MKIKYLLLSLAILFVSCQKQKKVETSKSPPSEDSLAWVEAQKINTIDAYNDFICKYPKSKFVELATLKINKLKEEQLWQKTIEINTIDAYHNFCALYPYSVHHGEAIENVDKILKEQLHTKYHTIIDFLRIMSNDNNYKNFKNFIDTDFLFIKIVNVEATGNTYDTIKITNKQIYDKYLKNNIFATCYNIYLQDTSSENKKYHLLCCPEGIGIVFTHHCNEITFKWRIYEDKLLLRRLEITNFVNCD